MLNVDGLSASVSKSMCNDIDKIINDYLMNLMRVYMVDYLTYKYSKKKAVLEKLWSALKYLESSVTYSPDGLPIDEHSRYIVNGVVLPIWEWTEDCFPMPMTDRDANQFNHMLGQCDYPDIYLKRRIEIIEEYGHPLTKREIVYLNEITKDYNNEPNV